MEKGRIESIKHKYEYMIKMHYADNTFDFHWLGLGILA